MFIYQPIPINPKDWSIVGPVILGIALLVILGIYALKELKKAGILASNGNGADVAASIAELRTKLAEHERRIGRHQEEFIEDLRIMGKRVSSQHDRISKLEK